MPVLFIIVIVVVIVVAIIFSAIAAKKRREALMQLASKLGFSYSPDKDRGMDDQYGHLNALRQGSNRYAFNIIKGDYQGHRVQVFDYHYETHSTDSKGRRQTHHHHFSFFIMTLERSFPELIITKEGIFSKIAQAIGFDDIDFESHEFSRKFCVKSKNKKFAYDVCNAQMIEYLLANTDMNIEIEHGQLALAFKRKLGAEEIEHNLGRLERVRSLMPEYLFKD